MKDFFQKHKRWCLGVLAAIFFAVITILLSILAASWMTSENLQSLERFFESLGFGGWILMFLVQTIRIVFPVMPDEPFELLAGAMYGSFLGTITCVLGILTGSLIVFFIVRKFGVRLLYRIMKPEKLEQYDHLRHARTLDKISFLIYFLPGVPKDFYTYFVGLTNMSVGKFIFFVTFARLPSVVSSTMAADMVMRGQVFWGIVMYAIVGAISILGLLFHKQVLQRKE